MARAGAGAFLRKHMQIVLVTGAISCDAVGSSVVIACGGRQVVALEPRKLGLAYLSVEVHAPLQQSSSWIPAIRDGPPPLNILACPRNRILPTSKSTQRYTLSTRPATRRSSLRAFGRE